MKFANSVPYKDTKFMGGRDVALKTYSVLEIFAKSTIQRYINSRVDVGVTNLQCPRNLQSLPYKNTKNKGWTLVLQTYNVLPNCKVYHTEV